MWFTIQKNNPIWYFCVLNNILTSIPYQNGDPSLFSMISYDKLKKFQIPIFQFVTVSKDFLDVKNMIESCFNIIQKSKYKTQDSFFIPPLIVVDYSISMLDTFCTLFNRMNSIDYFNLIYSIQIDKIDPKINRAYENFVTCPYINQDCFLRSSLIHLEISEITDLQKKCLFSL